MRLNEAWISPNSMQCATNKNHDAEQCNRAKGHIPRDNGIMGVMKSAILSAEEVERYKRTGFLCPLPALSERETESALNALTEFESRAGATLGKLPGQIRAKTHLVMPWLNDLIRHPRILDVVQALIGPDILVYHVTCWLKEPGEGSFVSWHQDGTYFHLHPAEHLTAWIALTPSTPERGCVRVLPGTHRDGQQVHQEFPNADNLLSNGQTLEIAEQAEEAVDLTLRPGQMSLHHTHLIHASGRNTTPHRRIGIGISYIPTRVEFLGPTRVTATLVRGRDTYSHFDPEPAPKHDADDDAVAFHERACQRFFAAHGSARSPTLSAS